jgi:iron complex outermembrane receptor protein
MKTRLFILSLFASSFALADDVRQLAPTVVTATRVETNSFDLPVSIDVVDKEDIQDGQLGMTLAESLIRVGGITANNRTQMAQDPQISSRGFGARSAFGVRGIRVLVDGIPLTMPDGIGQPGSVDLNNLKSIEVMRGPFSALYGSSSGGVINMRTEDISKVPEVNAGIMFGSYGTRKEDIGASGSIQGIDYLIDTSNFSTDGYRDNSKTDKNQATVKLTTKINNGSTDLTLLGNWFDQRSQDPIGLPRIATTLAGSAFSSPQSVSVATSSTKARVIRNNAQLGFNIEHNFNENNQINLMTYVGHRYNSQFLPTGADQALNVKSSVTNDNGNGKDSIYQRSFWGNDIRWNNKGDIFSKPYSFSLGLNYGYMSDARLEKNAYNGELLSESTSANFIKRDEINIGYNFDQYFQGQISPINSVDLHAGVRRSTVGLRIEDHINNPSLYDSGSSNSKSLTAKYLDGNGELNFQKVTPVMGVVWKANEKVNLYANYGKGFETPTFIEIAYSDTLVGGQPNFSLKPSKSENFEAGIKAFVGSNTRINAAIYKVNAYQEIVASSSGTYSVYTNAGKTNREGIELSIDSALPYNFNFYGSLNYLDATFQSDFTDATGNVKKDNKISGTYREQVYGEISWKYPEFGFKTALEAKHNSNVYVNNTNTDQAPDYTILNIRAGFEQAVSKWKLKEFVRVENLTDKDYIGSVRINDSNSRFFEPAAGRNYMIGITTSYTF